MWSIVTPRRFGGISMRRITLFVSVILVTLFATSVINTTPVGAQAVAGNATRNEKGLLYNGNTYEELASVPSESEDFTFHASACRQSNGSVYVYTPFDDRATNGVNGAGAICMVSENRAWYVWFPNAHLTTDGRSLVFGDGTITEQYKNIIVSVQNRYEQYVGFPTGESTAGEPKNPSINPRPEGLSDAEWDTMWSDIHKRFHANIENEAPITIGQDTPKEATKACDGEYTLSVGWLICPVTNWLAKGLDQFYNILSSFLVVAPIFNDKDSAIYYSWGIMQDFANVMLIIGFLVLIYSQITGVGVSNYGIKRLLLRLLAAAILINLSFYIAALAVDFSNVIGHGIKSMFDTIGANMPPKASANLDYKFTDLSWQALAGVSLSGGAALAVGAGAVITFVGSAGASLYFLLVALVSATVSALVAILVIAARQAIITILIIIAPLAFAAYLLPSTEKYFERWRSIFTTLLLVFPLFSLVFGGSRLASMAIMYSADPTSPNFFNLIVLGMLVQVIPLAITPLLVQISGSLVGRIAGIVNNPNRGFVDQTRKFAQQRHDLAKGRRLWGKGKDGGYAHNWPGVGLARKMAVRGMDNERQIDTYKQGADAAYHQSKQGHEAHRQSEINTTLKNTGDEEAKASFARDVMADEALRRMRYRSKLAADEAALATQNMENAYDDLKAAGTHTVDTAATNDIARRVQQTAQEIQSATYHLDGARRVQDENYNEALAKGTDEFARHLRVVAGNEAIDEHGPARILNIVQERAAKASEERINAAVSMLGREESTLDEEFNLLLGKATTTGRFKGLENDLESRRAVLRRFVSRAPMERVHRVYEQLDITSDASRDPVAATMRSELEDALGKRGPLFLSQTIRNQILEGKLDPAKFKGPIATDSMIEDFLRSGGLDAKALATGERDDLKAIGKYLAVKENQDKLSDKARKRIVDQIMTAYDPQGDYAGEMSKRDIMELTGIWNAMGLDPNADRKLEASRYMARYKNVVNLDEHRNSEDNAA